MMTLSDELTVCTVESFGVKVEISFPEKYRRIIERVLESGIGCYKLIHEGGSGEVFRMRLEEVGEDLCLFVDGEQKFSGETNATLSLFDTVIRREIAIRSDKVFVHSGVVGWKGKAIIFPASSYRGKTRLTTELVKRGAEYYSDEYAVIDKEGFVLPFPKYLSIRGVVDEGKQTDVPVQELGGKIGQKPIRIGLVLITEYKPDAEWSPVRLTKGQGLLEIISHAAPFSKNPENTLRILEKAIDYATILKSYRSEAADVADLILSSV